GVADIEAMFWAKVGGREAFERSFDARTFSPERRAAQAIADAVDLWTTGSAQIAEAGGTPDVVEAWQAKFMRLWLDYQRSGARVLNWMITGPARFPVERNNKRLEVERRRGEEFMAHAQGAAEWVRRRQRSAEKAALSAEAATVEHDAKAFPGGRLVKNTTLA